MPRWARELLRRLVPPDRAEDLIGDFEEAHRRRLGSRGRRAATLLTTLEILEAAVILVAARARRPRRHRREGPRAPGATGPRVSWVDLKLGLRMLRKYPVLTGVSIVPMAVAVAAAAGAYAVTDSILHPRLPFAESERIVGIENWDVAAQSSDARLLHDFTTWREELTSVVDLGAFETFRPNLILEGGGAEPLHGSRISASAFRITGVPPLLGRPLLESDERPGAPDVAVIGYGLWRDVFGGDAQLVGKSIQIAGAPTIVVGVMPPGYAFPYNDEIWVPLRDDEREWQPLEGPRIFVFGRLRGGTEIADAQGELDVLGRRAAAEHPDTYRSIRARIVPYGTNLWGGPTLALNGLRVVLVLLLLVVCSTVGVLIFVRNLSREGEVTLRFFLGASRGRIVAQLFSEALVMAAVASVLGLVLMAWGLQWVHAAATSASAGEGGLPFWIQPRLAPGTLYYVGALTLLGAGLSGLLPAVTLTRHGGGSRLQRLPTGGGTLRIGTKGTVAIAGQTALTVGLLALVGARWGAIAGGGEPNPVVASSYLTAELRPGQVPATNDEKDAVLRRVLSSSQQVASRLSAAPDVTGITLGSSLPGQTARAWRIEVEGGVGSRDADRAHLAWVDSGYFSVLNIPLLSGRSFEAADVSGDGSSPPVAIVNRSFAKHWFGDESPLGERVRFVGAVSAYPGDPREHPWAEVIGVVSDVGMSLRDPASPMGLYLPLHTGTYPMRMAVRVAGNPVDLSSTLRSTVATADPWLRLGEVTTLANLVEGAQSGQRTIFVAALLATLAAVALSLSAIYAVVSFVVGQRTREIGIRIALGGRPGLVVVGILSHSLRRLGVGVALGLGAMWLLRIGNLTSLGWETLLVVSAATIAAGLAASLAPAVRAANVQPTTAIRTEGG